MADVSQTQVPTTSSEATKQKSLLVLRTNEIVEILRRVTLSTLINLRRTCSTIDHIASDYSQFLAINREPTGVLKITVSDVTARNESFHAKVVCRVYETEGSAESTAREIANPETQLTAVKFQKIIFNFHIDNKYVVRTALSSLPKLVTRLLIFHGIPKETIVFLSIPGNLNIWRDTTQISHNPFNRALFNSLVSSPYIQALQNVSLRGGDLNEVISRDVVNAMVKFKHFSAGFFGDMSFFSEFLAEFLLVNDFGKISTFSFETLSEVTFRSWESAPPHHTLFHNAGVMFMNGDVRTIIVFRLPTKYVVTLEKHLDNMNRNIEILMLFIDRRPGTVSELPEWLLSDGYEGKRVKEGFPPWYTFDQFCAYWRDHRRHIEFVP